MDLELTLCAFGIYAIGTLVGVALSESRFESRMKNVLRGMAEDGFIRHRVEDDTIVFLKYYDNTENK